MVAPLAAPRRNYRPYAVLLGLAFGFGLAVRYLPGGYDAFTFYLRAPAPDTTAPAWVYLFTYPLSFLGWPLGWQVLTFLSVLAAGAAGLVWANNRWWIVLVTTPMLWNVWLGQIELFPVVGLLLTGLVLQKKLHPAWLGLSWLLLLTKPQVGLGVLLLQAQALWRQPELRKPALLYGGGVCVGLLGLTFAAWPGWLPNWLATMRAFTPTWWNAAVWPAGLLAWPLALVAAYKAEPLRQARLFSAAALLGSSYFALYHCTTLLSLTDSLVAVAVSWLIVLIGNGQPELWMRWGWLLPASILVIDLAQTVWVARRAPALAAVSKP
jgi:hypothetical protein